MFAKIFRGPDKSCEAPVGRSRCNVLLHHIRLRRKFYFKSRKTGLHFRRCSDSASIVNFTEQILDHVPRLTWKYGDEQHIVYQRRLQDAELTGHDVIVVEVRSLHEYGDFAKRMSTILRFFERLDGDADGAQTAKLLLVVRDGVQDGAASGREIEIFFYAHHTVRRVEKNEN